MVSERTEDWPLVYLLLTTYKRTELALESIRLIKEHLFYPNLWYHIADDNSQETDDGTNRRHVDVLADAIGGNVSYHEMSTPPGEINLGGCVNAGIQIAFEHGAEMVFITCDDDAPLAPFDMRPYADLLQNYPEVGAARCAPLSEGLGLNVTSTRVSRLDGQEYLWGRVVRDWSMHSPWQTQAYLSTFDMILYHKRFFDAYGMFPENEHPGLTEVHYCAKYNDSPLGESGPQVWVSLGKGPGSQWFHIGKGQRAHAYLAATPNYRKDEE